MILVTGFDDRKGRGDMDVTEFAGELVAPVRHRKLYHLVKTISGGLTVKPDVTPTAGQAGTPNSEPLDRPFKLLLAEDNPINQKVAGLIFKKLGYTYRIVNNGQEAVEALADETFDAVLMDVQMPIMDGLEATRYIRDPQSDVLDHEVIIVAMTAHAMDSDRTRCLAAGMDEHLTKPISSEALAAMLDKFLLVGIRN